MEFIDIEQLDIGIHDWESLPDQTVYYDNIVFTYSDGSKKTLDFKLNNFLINLLDVKVLVIEK